MSDAAPPPAPPVDVPPAPGRPLSDADRLAREIPTECLNCGAVLPGAFCPACGQRAEARRRSLGALSREVGADFFGLDGRLWRSLAGLLVRPGHLTQAYLAGRRTRYLRPFRLYLSASLAFFFLLSVLDPAARLERTLADTSDADTLVTPAARIAEIDSLLAVRRAPADTARAVPATPAGAPRLDDRPNMPLDGEARRLRRLALERRLLVGMRPDSALSTQAIGEAVSALASPAEAEIFVGNVDGALDRGAFARIMRATTRAEMARATAEVVRTAIARVPTVMFVLLPLFALLLKLLYARRDWYYAEHVVFALHTHAFAFVVFALALVLIVVDGVSEAARSAALSAGSVIIPVYFLLAQKRVYGQSWRKTLVKAVLLGFAYAMLLAVGLIGAAALAALE